MSFGIFALILTIIYAFLMMNSDDVYGIDMIVYSLLYVAILIIAGPIWFFFF